MTAIPAPDAAFALDTELHAQWEALRAWLASREVSDAFDESSVLVGWTVRDLVAHLGRGFDAIRVAVATSTDEPLSLFAYVTRYADAATQIAEGTRGLTVSLGDDLLDGVDALADAGFAALARLSSPVVIGPRGPISRADFVATRLLELVVHADDLARSVPQAPASPIRDEALGVVADALAEAYRVKTGGSADDPAGLAWVRAAAGRTPSLDPALPLL